MSSIVFSTRVTGLPNSYVMGGEAGHIANVNAFQTALEEALTTAAEGSAVYGRQAVLSGGLSVRSRVDVTNFDDSGQAQLVTELVIDDLPNRLTAAGTAALTELIVDDLSPALGAVADLALMQVDGVDLEGTVSYGNLG